MLAKLQVFEYNNIAVFLKISVDCHIEITG